MSPAPSESPIFIGGVPRSGTTLLRVMLDSHSRIACGTELRVVQALANLWSAAESSAGDLLGELYDIDEQRRREIFGELILSFLRPSWRASGKPRIAEKTPSNLHVFHELARIFPRSPLIHVIRDGRDVVASRLEREMPASTGSGADRVSRAALHAREWVEAMRLRKRLLADSAVAPSYFELRYEALVSQPQATLLSVLDFLGERFEPQVLEFHRLARNVDGTEEWSADAVRRPVFSSSVGRWQEALDPDEQAAVIGTARDTLIELGYLDAEGAHGV